MATVMAIVMVMATAMVMIPIMVTRNNIKYKI